jgi:hypothetical protein
VSVTEKTKKNKISNDALAAVPRATMPMDARFEALAPAGDAASETMAPVQAPAGMPSIEPPYSFAVWVPACSHSRPFTS